MRRSSRIGFTLVELLVVIAIIGVLVGLLIPAVQMAREAARKAQCQSNMRQVALSIQSFENSKRRYPGFLELYGNGTGNVGKVGTWVVPILPYLEQNPAYEVWSSSTENANWVAAIGGDADQFARFYPHVPQLVCASNYLTVTKQKVARNSYVCNAGFLPITNTPLPPGYSGSAAQSSIRSQRIQNGVCTNQLLPVVNGTNVFGAGAQPVKVRADSVKDGLSSTMAVSENFQAIEWNNFSLTDDSTRYSLGMGWLYRDDPGGKVTAGRMAPAPVQPVNQINGPKGQLVNAPIGSPESARPSSGHTGVVNVGFLDGSVRSISDEISYATYQNLMTPQTRGSDMPNTFHVLPADVSE